MTEAEKELLEACLNQNEGAIEKLRMAVLRDRAPAELRERFIRAKADVFLSRKRLEAIHATELARASGMAGWYPPEEWLEEAKRLAESEFSGS